VEFLVDDGDLGECGACVEKGGKGGFGECWWQVDGDVDEYTHTRGLVRQWVLFGVGDDLPAYEWIPMVVRREV